MLSGFQLKMLRVKKKVNQTKIADDLGVTRPFISMIENEVRYLNEEQYKQYLNSLYKHAYAEEEATEETKEIEQIENDTDKKVKKTSKKSKK
ncbi:helix-turn-helix domain-containing protein [Anaerophilus nitritogenes]|uniref:helix-turn-helix domain-containing protein n=1 Tax=Anaerophilus nitritogenes TaxID=2498136 RepID=UPI00101BCECA|nr:helix-turn-helix transcriptional regulator [Anaerophilus nitritogenes]